MSKSLAVHGREDGGGVQIPTAISMLLQKYSQEMSALVFFVVTTATRTMATTITMTVREKIPIRASFLRSEIWTFQSIRIGIVMTAGT